MTPQHKYMDFKERRQLAHDRVEQHLYIKKEPTFFHKPCKGITKQNTPCAISAGKGSYCRMYKPK